MDTPQLLLRNQLCFPLYAASRLVTKLYQPLLEDIGITYPQYLILLVLWEQDKQSVTEIGSKLFLDTNTLTPLISRMEKKELVTRNIDNIDTRKRIVGLTKKGVELKLRASLIPEKLIKSMEDGINADKALNLREDLHTLIKSLLK